MDEDTLRKMAIEQYLQGKAPVLIYSELGRTKPWFFKWLHQYQAGDTEWYKDKSKTPHGHPHETSPEMQKLVTNIRIQLEEHPYAQVGTSAIKWEFKKLGITPPADRTINRILKREGLLKKNSSYSQGSGISLFQGAPGIQQHPSGGPHRTQIHQKRWPLLFPQRHGSLQSPSLSSPSTKEGRSNRGSGLDPLLEGNGRPRLSSSRQRTLFPWKQSLPSLFWHRPQTLPIVWNRGGLHTHWRTLA